MRRKSWVTEDVGVVGERRAAVRSESCRVLGRSGSDSRERGLDGPGSLLLLSRMIIQRKEPRNEKREREGS